MSDDGPKLMVILPGADRDALSNGLRELTKAIVERYPDRHRMGIFGGYYGYGARWDSEVFSMHPFCWCDDNECAICNSPNFYHKASGFKVDWYKYIGRGMKIEGECDWPEVLAECLSTVKE